MKLQKSLLERFEKAIKIGFLTVFFQGFGESSTELKLVAWAARETFFEMRNTLQPAIKAALDDAGVRLALPNRVLMPAPEGPLRVEVVGDPSRAPQSPPQG